MTNSSLNEYSPTGGLYRVVQYLPDGTQMVHMEPNRGYSFIKDEKFIKDKRGARRSWGTSAKAIAAWKRGIV